MSNSPTSSNKPQVGASACLNGHKVRFDGGHKSSTFVSIDCNTYFDLHVVCPEMEIGLGAPRPVIQLRDFDGVRKLVFSKTPEKELTETMQNYAKEKMKSLPQLDGFVFKKDSPSCGLSKVPVVNNKSGMRKRDGVGVFTEVFKAHNPNVPTEDEGRLNDIHIRENFLERVYAHYRWRQIDNAESSIKAFRDYHKNYKLILMAKDNQSFRKLGQLVAKVNNNNLDDIREEYFNIFMSAMKKIPSHGHHINVMMHVMGYLKDKLNNKDKLEILEWLETYREKRIARITPMMLLIHHFNRHPNQYISEQYYFSPFPKDLMLPV